MTRTVIVFATDAAFEPLARGLVLSLLDHGLPESETEVRLVNLGCSEDFLAWLRERGIAACRFERAHHLPPFPGAQPPRYLDAMACRPFLRELLPGYDIYMWIDSDIWIQDRSSLALYRSLAIANPGHLVVSPMVDYSYHVNYGDNLVILSTLYDCYRLSYDVQTAERYKGRTVFGGGIWAMGAGCPVWDRWAGELRNVYARDYSERPLARHLAEQTALNHTLYDTGLYLPVEAIHNYNCHVGLLRRDQTSGRVVIAIPPCREIGVVHLTNSGELMARYLAERLLYRGGDYLEACERQALLGRKHY